MTEAMQALEKRINYELDFAPDDAKQLQELLNGFNPTLPAKDVFAQLGDIRQSLTSLVEAVDEARNSIRGEIHH